MNNHNLAGQQLVKVRAQVVGAAGGGGTAPTQY